MYVIIAPIQIKNGYKDRFIEEMISDAKGSINNEPGCLRFEVIQDAEEPNRIWLYEVYKDAEAFDAHTKAPHFIKWRDATADWINREEDFTDARGASNIWPADDEWE